MYLHIFSEIREYGSKPNGKLGFVHPSEIDKFDPDVWFRWNDMAFAVPVDKHNHLLLEYKCQTIVYKGQGKYEKGPDFILKKINDKTLAVITPQGKINYIVSNTGRYKYLNYVGHYKHEDYTYKFANLVQHDERLKNGKFVTDVLYEKKHIIILGYREDSFYNE